MTAPRWWELIDLEWEAEWALHSADWAVESVLIDLDGERRRGGGEHGGQPDAAAEA